jgi:hypothetical protein
MNQHEEQDPFAGLDDWAKKTERKIRSEGRRVKLRRGLVFLGGGVLIALVLASTLPVVRALLPVGSASATDSDARPYPTQSTPAGVTVTTSESAASTDPFAGTPAATYPKGAAGITLPPAKAVTGYSAAQVRADLQRVRSALIAARLDHRMLITHDPAKFLGLLSTSSHDDIGPWFKKADFDTLATWISPVARLDGREQPRVSGRVTYASTTVGGLRTLRVTTNFVWVYAFEGAAHPLVAAHEEIRWDFPIAPNLRTADRGMHVSYTKGYQSGVDCAAAAQGMLAPTPVDAMATPDPQDSEDQNNYLRADHSLDITDNCGNNK